MDATGSLCLSVELPNGKKSSHLMPYSCVCKTEAYSFPAFHMMSSKQDTQTITDFLVQIKMRVLVLKIFVSDFGKAI